MTAALALLIPLAWRNLWRNPRRTAITLAVVATGIWSILIFTVMLEAVAESGKQQSLRLLTGEGQVHAAGYLADPGVDRRLAAPAGSLLATLGAPPLGAWAPRVRVPAVIESEYRTRAITFLGVSPAAEGRVSDLPGQILAGRYLRDDDDAGLVIGADLAAKLKTGLGKRLIVMAQGADGRLTETGYEIVGLFGNTRPAQDEYVFTGLHQAQTALGMAGALSEISFDAAAPAGPDAAVAALKRAAPDLDVVSWATLSPLAWQMETISRTYVNIWLAVMFVLMAIGIVNTQLMAVYERTREFGLLQALGLRPGLIILQVSLESTLLVGMGVLAGLALVLATVLPLSGGLDLGPYAGAAAWAGLGEVLHPRLDPAEALRACLIVWVLGVLAALWPARAAARASPAAAMAAS